MKMKKGLKKMETNNAQQKEEKMKRWQKKEQRRTWSSTKMVFIYIEE